MKDDCTELVYNAAIADQTIGAEANDTEIVTQFEIVDLTTKAEIEKLYFGWHTFYYGTDEKYHYILTECNNTVHRILVTNVDNDGMVKLYKAKLALDRGPEPSRAVGKRNKEFLDWINKTKVTRIPDIDSKKDR